MSLFTQKNKNFKPLKPLSKSKIITNLILLILFLILFCYCSFSISAYHFDFSVISTYKEKFLQGFLNTLIISFFSLLLSIILGGVFCAFSLSSIVFLRFLSTFYIELIRGTPLLVQVLLMYYIIANNLGLDNRYVAGVIILSCFSAAYLAEIFRAGILSISISQLESARALGLKEMQVFAYVIFPQALKNILAPLSGQFANLIKDSSLLSVIAVNELTQSAQEINSYTFATLEAYVILAITYLILTLPISIFSRYLERKCQK
ncbi:TPA: amino acid ABC transporter permease [Campylobacter jejuni]|nr:amino acid ABC transporter permease [Campylobacter jejuni]ECQ6819925.1 amino acid ABC transporter permease [Campylobacter jejuni]ECQ9203287.1 amino acid ABC transporter permease [Campylobacter jejuni]EDP2721190.1 amino acid ABC transporter permease [Campylobacter jejuni]EIJ2486464.1 amino acid ABC transporter permease [Campylobacter jejuni]